MIDTHIEGSEAIPEKSKAKVDSLDHFQNARMSEAKRKMISKYTESLLHWSKDSLNKVPLTLQTY